CVSYSEKNDYIFLKLHFLLWDAKSFNGSELEKKLENVVTISKKIGVNDAQISASVSLAATYELNNKNQEALDFAQATLALNPPRYNHKVTLLQISGMALFKQGRYNLAENYFDQALALAQSNKSAFLTALTYSFYGTLASQKGNYEKAENLFSKADIVITLVHDLGSKNDLNSRIIGYRAKSQLMQGNYEKAAKLYKDSIDLIQPFATEKSLEMAELNKGMATSLSKNGSSTSNKYDAIASYYLEQANAKNEKVSCLLSFVPISCK
ncbi:MAG: hypothetical protein FD167_5856, partial [bacterium]